MSQYLNNIKARRAELGYSQEYMGINLNMAQVTYGQIENGKRRLTVDVLIQIALILKTSASALLGEPPLVIERLDSNTGYLQNMLKDKNEIIELLKFKILQLEVELKKQKAS